MISLLSPSNNLGTFSCKESQFVSQTQLSRGQSLIKESQCHKFGHLEMIPASAIIKDGIHHVNELNFISTVLPLIVPAAKDSPVFIM